MFVIRSLSKCKTSFIIIPPGELLQGLQRIFGSSYDNFIDFWVTKTNRCWEVRKLPKAVHRSIDHGNYSAKDRDFSAYLNAWDLVAKRLR